MKHDHQAKYLQDLSPVTCARIKITIGLYITKHIILHMSISILSAHGERCLANLCRLGINTRQKNFLMNFNWRSFFYIRWQEFLLTIITFRYGIVIAIIFTEERQTLEFWHTPNICYQGVLSREVKIIPPPKYMPP